jgi:hypothetical protein
MVKGADDQPLSDPAGEQRWMQLSQRYPEYLVIDLMKMVGVRVVASGSQAGGSCVKTPLYKPHYINPTI